MKTAEEWLFQFGCGIAAEVTEKDIARVQADALRHAYGMLKLASRCQDSATILEHLEDQILIEANRIEHPTAA